MADVAEIHHEASELMVSDHNKLISKQFLLACHLPSHPCHAISTAVPEPRPNIKPTLLHSFRQDIQMVLPADGLLDRQTYHRCLKDLHTAAVVDAKNRSTSRVLLGGRPPPIHYSEKLLPRAARTALAQYRTGFSKHLNSYRSRVDPAVVDSCPDCGGAPHDTRHLFNCPGRPTALAVIALWTDPAAAASFLDLPLT